MSDRRNYLSKISEIPDFTNAPARADFHNGQSFNFPELNQSRYDFRSHIFPSDLGKDDNGHYAVFNINVPTGLSGATSGTPIGAYQRFFSALPGERSKVDKLRGGGAGISFGTGGNAPAAFLPRSTVRIAESIALFMPTPLVFNTHNVYEEVSLTALGGKLGVGVEKLAGVAAGIFGRSVTAGLASAVASGTGQIVGTVAKLAQAPINPLVEILFSTTAVRQFTFEVLMAPRNEVESKAARDIIKTFRFHGAPEIGLANLLWIPPAEFDITFFNKGTENPNLIRINTCVLERIEVDYAPASGVYSTFRNGHPVSIRLSLGFRELEPLHKRRILEGF